MSLISAPESFTFRKRPARMYVVRNDGFCYGRLCVTQPSGVIHEHDVATKRDYYERDDADAAQAFINAARRGNFEEPMASWRLEAST